MIGWVSPASAMMGHASGGNTVIHADGFCGKAHGELIPVHLTGRFASLPRCQFCQPAEAPGEWADRAACKGADSDLFFAESVGGGAYRQARRICDQCSVLADCREYGLRSGQEFGMFGGLSPCQRESILSERCEGKVIGGVGRRRVSMADARCAVNR